MKKLVRASVLALSLALSCAAAKEHVPPERLDQWMTYYYLDSRPDEIAAALRAVTTGGYFENDSVQAPFSGFFAEIFRSNPGRLDAWVEPYLGVPKLHILYSALWMSNSSESRVALERLAKSATAAEAKKLRELASTKPPTVETMKISSPAALDYMWGYFMASGSDKPVLRIIDQMKLVNRTGDIEAKILGGAAQWSVSANVRQHDQVQQIVRAEAKTADPETRALLTAILAKLDAEPSSK